MAEEAATRANQAVLRALEILDLFSEQAPELSLGEVASRLNLNPGTAFRLLKTLEDARYVCRDESGKRYRLSLRPLVPAKVVLNTQPARIAAHGYLASLARAANANANLAVLDGLEIVYLDRASHVADADPYVHSGRRAPAHCTALGKALLAYNDGALASHPDVELTRYTEHTIVDRDVLVAALGAIREQGYAGEDSECAVGSICLAAPIFDARGRAVAAVSLSTTRSRLGQSNLHDHLPRLLLAATEISHRLGYGLYQPA